MRLAAAIVGCTLLVGIGLPGASADTAQVDEHQLLEPGEIYVANFSYKERREACLFLSYAEWTAGFDHCLRGYFLENPWFAS